MDLSHHIALALHSQCLQLWDAYFIGVAHAPVMYLTLGRSVESVAFALEHLCMESSHPNSRTCGLAVSGSNHEKTRRVHWADDVVRRHRAAR